MRKLLAFVLYAAYAAGMVAAPKLPPAHEFFTDGRVRAFKITVEQPGLSVLEKNDRSYVKATITEGTNVYKDVGIHLKGMGSFRPFNEKPSFAVKFDKYVDKQEFHGLSKLMLNNSSQDGTYLAELIATQMFRDAGQPAARVTHAFVEVNGRALGLYVAIEAMNKDFLKQYFRNTKGNLYEAYLQDIGERLDQDGGTDMTQSDLTNLVAVAKIKKLSERWDALQRVLEVDKYISHLALELFASHTDGYARNRNNYRLYHDPSTGKFNFLVHGLDWAYADTGVPIDPPRSSIITRAVIQTPQGRQLYRERVRQLYTNTFRVDVMTNRVNTTIANLKRAARTENEAREFENYGNEMRNRIVARHRNIAEQLAKPEPQPLAFDSNGTAQLSGWKQKEAGDRWTQDEAKLDGRSTFHIRAVKGDTIASWRTSVLLDEGIYQLHAMARVAGVTALTNDVKLANGAGLRISGGKRTQQLLGNSDWTPLEYEFEVEAGGEEKELVCELRAREGEVWFDAAALKLIRRK
ncbi:MAG: CotH kinase family protein [Verrucomicrobia bacterium]|nr:CotH kinase family protein [Verrucomicrobiota bacterium]